MIPALAALLLAHAFADFILQTNWMAANKRNPKALSLHAFAVLTTAAVCSGTASPWLLALTALHIAIDLIKSFWPKRGVLPFLLDQAAHLASLLLIAPLLPAGVWQYPTAAPLMALTAGMILSTRAGGFAVGLLMAPWVAEAPAGLPGGGRIIGLLERALIFILILTGQAQGVGYLVAAKSVLRFGTISDDRAVSEYVIIGTLASFGWAIAAVFATVFLMSLLPPLGIPDLTP